MFVDKRQRNGHWFEAEIDWYTASRFNGIRDTTPSQLIFYDGYQMWNKFETILNHLKLL